MYVKHDYYVSLYDKINNIYIKGASAPRGRILDIKGKVIVDNLGVNTILYHKPNSITVEEEIEIAKKLSYLTNYSYRYDESKLKDFFMIIKKDIVEGLITDEERKLYNERKITKEELEELKKERITDEVLDTLTLEEKYASYFYNLMNDGYYYDNKIILKEVSEEVYAEILEEDLPGIFGEIAWVRYYPYEDTLKSLLGSISNSLPEDKKDLLNKGYSLTDKVGISGLEEYYEEYLRGEKAVYKLEDGKLVLVSPASRGNDLVLEIDMDIQLKVEEIMKKEMAQAKKVPNTEYYNESYVLIANPKTGGIVASTGLRINDKDLGYQDVTINITKNAYTVGSIVKGASMAVGYQNKVIDIGSTMLDSCVKLNFKPAKCSWTRLGVINDIDALAQSSNYYQFIIALGVAGYKYKYNMDAPVKIEDFNKYRDTFASFGLGNTTGIDLPRETSGLKGNIVAPDLLMNLAIGQYDLYTPLSLLQYMGTIANKGVRLKLRLGHSIIKDEKVIEENPVTELNKVDLEEKYLNRIEEGLVAVMNSGTGYYYAPRGIKAAGKTGTSESYIDINGDGRNDAYVISNTFAMYAPYDDPKYVMVVISPNTSNLNGKSSYQSGVNRLIAREINDYLFSS